VLLCEDQPSPHLLGIDPRGRLYPIAFNAGFKSELTGVIVTPDKKQVLVNIQDAGLTVAIHGPWV
jgi:secreted PhoX family phosphatase